MIKDTLIIKDNMIDFSSFEFLKDEVTICFNSSLEIRNDMSGEETKFKYHLKIPKDKKVSDNKLLLVFKRKGFKECTEFFFIRVFIMSANMDGEKFIKN